MAYRFYERVIGKVIVKDVCFIEIESGEFVDVEILSKTAELKGDNGEMNFMNLKRFLKEIGKVRN